MPTPHTPTPLLLPSSLPPFIHPSIHSPHPPVGRFAQPCEIAPSYVLLAGEDGSFMSGTTLHPSGGMLLAT